MTDAQRLAAIKCSLIRSMTVNRELIDKVREYSGEEFIPQEAFTDHNTCFYEGTNFGAGSYAESLLNQYFPKEG